MDVKYSLHWAIITKDKGVLDFTVSCTPHNGRDIFDLALIFGKLEGSDTFIVPKLQYATPELKSKVKEYVSLRSTDHPRLHRLRQVICDLEDSETFVILQNPATDEIQKAQNDLFLLMLPQDKLPAAGFAKIRETLSRINKVYNMISYTTDRDTLIGNRRKADRKCRFCSKSVKDGGLFKKQAHAIPSALGNKYLKLADECDDCNQYFGNNVEPDLIEMLNIPRAFFGIKSKGSVPDIRFSNGSITSLQANNDEKPIIVVTADKILEDDFGRLVLELASSRQVTPQNIYRALGKIALSVIPHDELASLSKTIKWVRYGEAPPQAVLPKIAVSVIPLPPNSSAQIALYVRKEPHSQLPHVLCEFRLGCYVYLYILPFSDQDKMGHSNFFEKESFNEIFPHYSQSAIWEFRDYNCKKSAPLPQYLKIGQP